MGNRPTIAVKLNADDLWFICESMSCNIPCSEDMSPKELETYDKLNSAQTRLRRIESKEGQSDGAD